MATVTLTKDNFTDVLEGDRMVLVDFWASWCGPCRFFAPVFEKVSERHPEIVFAKVDTEVERELAGAFEIRSIPTLMIVRDRTVIFQQAGALPEDVLEDLIGKAAAVDMDEARRRAGVTAES